MKKETEKKVIAVLNKYSLLFHAFLACGVCFVIEWISRHSFLEACEFVLDRNLVFLYNSMLVFASLMLVYLVKRRAVMRMIISVFWLFLGTINGCILAKRVTPFGFTDLKMVGDLFTMQSNYFTVTEAAIVVVLVALVLISLVAFWIKGPKFAGKTRPVCGLGLIAVMLLMIPSVTDAAVSNNILTSYFENLAQGYKDYGFVYSFSASVLDRGMSAPEDYSQETVTDVLQKIDEDTVATADADSEGGASLEAVQAVRTTTADDVHMDEPSDGRSEDVGSEGRKGVGEDPQEETADDTSESDENSIEAGIEKIPEEGGSEQEYPNIICILLESFVDPETIRFLNTSEDPIPNFHALCDTYTSGYLEVPVVGAGTANTEFEVLTGMGMQFFGLGEYPYKTILKETNCESIASDLHTLGYGTHVVHNNGGNFYSRRNAFSMMGFDTFTSKELMDIQEYTPLGTWPTDDILIGEVEKSLNYTPDQPDFVYTITVEGHGDYPKEKVLENPDIAVTGPEDEGMRYAWEYYVNQIHEVDEFIGDLIEMLSERDEKTFVVMFGDHLPTMGLTEEDMTTGSLFLTKYATWNNFGLEKEDSDMTSYQLLADITEQLGISNGTMFTFHQKRHQYTDEEEYQKDMELLQYDILYGEHYVYGGENPYPASDLIMGTEEVEIQELEETDEYLYLNGANFTKWSKVYVNGTRVSTEYISSKLLRIKESKLDEGQNEIVVNQMGSSETIFRSSNTVYFYQEESD